MQEYVDAGLRSAALRVHGTLQKSIVFRGLGREAVESYLQRCFYKSCNYLAAVQGAFGRDAGLSRGDIDFMLGSLYAIGMKHFTGVARESHARN